MIPDVCGLVTATILNTKTSGIQKKKMRNNNSLATTTVFNAKISEVLNEIPGHDKYITGQEFNKLTAENFAARLKQANLVSKTDFNNKRISFNRNITSNKTKCLEVKKD